MPRHLSCRALFKMLPVLALLLAALALHHVASAGPSDAVLDAKRKAAAQLLRDGKVNDAMTILTEVIAADDTLYSDHLLMAHAQEKLGDSAEALAEYRHVLELLSPNPANPDERKARQEADKKVKQADPMAAKIDAAVDDYLRKLDALEREALAGRNMAALGRIFRLRGMTWQAERVKDRAVAEIQAKGDWQPAGLEVRGGQTYHVRAAGTWRVRPGGVGSLIECTAGGPTQNRKPAYSGACGQLMGQVDGKTFALGEDKVFTAPTSGPLQLIETENNSADRANNKGSLQVMIFAE
jgi:tetratricopeptide (TPR) repeat protein